MPVWSQLFGGGKKHTSDSPELIRQNIAEGKAVMLDVRSQEERDAGFLKDSIFIPIAEIKSLPDGTGVIEKLPKDKIIYCH